MTTRSALPQKSKKDTAARTRQLRTHPSAYTLPVSHSLTVLLCHSVTRHKQHRNRVCVRAQPPRFLALVVRPQLAFGLALLLRLPGRLAYRYATPRTCSASGMCLWSSAQNRVWLGWCWLHTTCRPPGTDSAWQKSSERNTHVNAYYSSIPSNRPVPRFSLRRISRSRTSERSYTECRVF